MLPDGIYTNLPMAVYRLDPALGGTDLKDILGNAVQWHAKARNATWRTLNPPSEDETAATKFGTALHTMALEPDQFDARYHLTPETPDLPDTKEEINAALMAIGRSPLAMGKKKLLFEAECRLAGVMLLDDWKDQQRLVAGERETISARWDRNLRLIRQMLDLHPKAMSFLRNGRAEVSVFWTDENGIRLKCRFDYLRVRTAADVKSYALRAGEEPIQNFADAIQQFSYDFTAAHYMDARLNAVPRLVAEGLICDGEYFVETGERLPTSTDDPAFFEAVADFTEPSWWWIACMTQGFPEVDTVEFPTKIMQFLTAQTRVDLAKRNYAEFRDRFGDTDSEAWVANRGLVRLTDYNFMNSRARDRGAVKWEPAE